MHPIFANTRRSLANLSLHRKGMVVIAIPVAALLAFTCLFTFAQRNSNRAADAVRHTLEVEKDVFQLMTTMLSLQSSVRDHSADEVRENAQYQKAKKQLPQQLERLQNLTHTDPAQAARVKTLREATGQLIAKLDAILASPPQPGKPLTFQQWIVKNQLPVAQAWQLLGLLYREEEQQLAARTKAGAKAQQISMIAVTLSVGLGLIGALSAARLFTTGITRRIQALEANADRLQQGLPLQPVMHDGDEIGRLGIALERASALLAQRSERLKLALQTARITVWEMDPATRRIRYEGKEEFLSSTQCPAELLPESLDELYRLVSAAERPDVEREFTETLTGDRELARECRLTGPDQQARWVSLTARQHICGQDAPLVLGVLMDVTERKKAEQLAVQQAKDLAASEQHLREQTNILKGILDSMGDGVVVADSAGKFLLFNPAAEKILGMGPVEESPEEWSHRYGIFGADQLTPCLSAEVPLARAMRGINVDAEELFVRNAQIPNGVWVRFTARPLKSDNGKASGAVVVFGDVTNRKLVDQSLRSAKEEAESANRAKSEFLSRMSHELRTPLNSILGFAQILQMQALAESSEECVDHILKGGKHLLRLIDEVLDIARIEAGKMALSAEPVLLADSVHEAIDMVRPLADGRGIRLEFDCPRACQEHALADRQRLHQVLLNLLANAVKYNRNGGQVRISCGSTASGFRISVSDTGAGIPESDQNRLFAPFERLNANLSGVEGSGLGLALSKRLMEAMGGAIGLTSVPGEGSTFWIDLPRADAPQASLLSLARMNNLAVKHLEGRRTVLYIEDNIANFRLMEHIVSFRPHIGLVPAMQGRLGLELAQEHNPDLILLDLHLPDISGEEVLRRLKAEIKTRAIPVIMISADATPGQVNRLLEFGAAAYMTKPLDVSKLLTVFDEHFTENSEQSHAIV